MGGEGDDRGWDGWMASLTWWTWVWVTSESYWWTGRPGMLQSLGSQRVRYDCSIWDLSSLIRDELMPLALAAGVLTTGPPGKSLLLVFCSCSRQGQEVETVWVSPLSKHEKWHPGPRWKGWPWTRAWAHLVHESHGKAIIFLVLKWHEHSSHAGVQHDTQKCYGSKTSTDTRMQLKIK